MALAEVLQKLRADEAEALQHAYAIAEQLAKARRAHRARQEEREEYERTGVIPRRLRRLALRTLNAEVESCKP